MINFIINFVKTNVPDNSMKRFISAAILLLATASFTGQWQAGARPATESRVSEQTPSVSVEKGFVELTSPDGEAVKFEIFSITGQLIKSVTVKGSTVKIDLPKGFYIIKCESWTKRVMLK